MPGLAPKVVTGSVPTGTAPNSQSETAGISDGGLSPERVLGSLAHRQMARFLLEGQHGVPPWWGPGVYGSCV